MICRLKRPVYGLNSASKAWYDRFLEVTEESGLVSKLSDEGMFRKVNAEDQSVGLLVLHVDDRIGGETDIFCAAMDKVCSSLEVGAK